MKKNKFLFFLCTCLLVMGSCHRQAYVSTSAPDGHDDTEMVAAKINFFKTFFSRYGAGDWFLVTLKNADNPLSYALKIIRTEDGDFQIDDAKRYIW